MQAVYLRDALDLDDDGTFNQKVETVGSDQLTLKLDRAFGLSQVLQPIRRKLYAQSALVSALEQPRPEVPMYLDRRANDASGECVRAGGYRRRVSRERVRRIVHNRLASKARTPTPLCVLCGLGASVANVRTS